MRIALVGYGKMGRLIDTLAPEYGCDVAARIDDSDSIGDANLAGVDVAIEFSTPHAVVGNIHRLAAHGVNIVVGTTGWVQQMDDVHRVVEQHNVGLIWSPNFSVGVNIFFRLVREAARLAAREAEYGAWGWEIHHDTKADAPSGTLLKLVDEMQKAGYDRLVDVSSSRAGRHPGTHEIGFDSQADTITLRHSARSREGFARGALKAAHWIVGKKGIYEFSEVLFE
jgi:4-hydroxy-tetrahydrodipicolinate reductase